MKKILIFIIFSFISFHSVASTKQQVGLWLGYFANHELNQTSSLHFETQLRHNTTESEMSQTLVRFGLLQKFFEKHTIGLLAAYADSDNAKEYRLTAQHQYALSTSFNLRQRIEGRDIENQEANSLRYRILLRYDQKFILWNESFINLSRENWSGDRAYERNRFFIGRKSKFKNFKLEWGYLNQFIPRSQRNTEEHILVSYFFF